MATANAGRLMVMMNCDCNHDCCNLLLFLLMLLLLMCIRQDVDSK